VMAYRPLLGIGPDYSLMHWEVIFTMVTTTLGLVAFAITIERYCLRRTTLVETALFAVATVGLLWPVAWVDGIGMIAFIAAVAMQVYRPAPVVAVSA
jgi:TRAP-type uncharacterized transport system fused permease subunit